MVHLEYSERQDDGTFLLLSSCKDGSPMLRDWVGDWVGTFLGHKGLYGVPNSTEEMRRVPSQAVLISRPKYGTRIQANACIRSRTAILFEVSLLTRMRSM